MYQCVCIYVRESERETESERERGGGRALSVVNDDHTLLASMLSIIRKDAEI